MGAKHTHGTLDLLDKRGVVRLTDRDGDDVPVRFYRVGVRSLGLIGLASLGVGWGLRLYLGFRVSIGCCRFNINHPVLQIVGL